MQLRATSNVLKRRIRVIPESPAAPGPFVQRLDAEQQAYVIERYGKPRVLGRCVTVSQFHPDVTIKSLAAEMKCNTSTIVRVLKRAGRKPNGLRGPR